MSARTIASMSVLLVAAGLLPSLPAKAEMPLNANLCNQVYQQTASASASQSSKSQNISGGGSYGLFSVSGGSQYNRSNAASQSDLQSYYEMNCDSYIQAVYGVKLADIQARERMNANNNQTSLQVTQNTNGSIVQMNREDNQTRRNESKNNLIGTGLGGLFQLGVAFVNRPRNPAPPVVQTVVNAPTNYQPAPATSVPPQAPFPTEVAPSQVAYAPQTAAFPVVLLTSNPNAPVSPIVTAKVNAALASQGLTPTTCNVSPIVVLNIANGQYTACAHPNAAYSAGNYRLNIPGF